MTWNQQTSLLDSGRRSCIISGQTKNANSQAITEAVVSDIRAVFSPGSSECHQPPEKAARREKRTPAADGVQQGQKLPKRSQSPRPRPVSIFSQHFLRPGQRSHHPGQEGADARLEQLPRSDESSEDQGGGQSRGREIRHGLRRFAVPERDAGDSPRTGTSARPARQKGSRAPLQHGV